MGLVKTKKVKVAVFGCGLWGFALSHALAKKFENVCLIGRNAANIKAIKSSPSDYFNLKKLHVSPQLLCTTDISCCQGSDVILIATPAQSLRDACTSIKKHVKNSAKIIVCSKGIEQSTLLLMTEVVAQVLKNQVFFLSGPNFAREIMLNLPAFANISGPEEYVNDLADLISTSNFVISPTTWVKSAQIFAALKNVMAIFFGLLSASGYGLNTSAAALVFAIKEIEGFCKAYEFNGDCSKEFCGIGDLVLTCYSQDSRNMSFGRGLITKSSRKDNKGLVEGLFTLKSAYQIAKKRKIHSPIIELLYKVIYKEEDPQKALKLFFGSSS